MDEGIARLSPTAQWR